MLQAGCDDIVHKPYQARVIFDAMERCLGVRYRYDEVAEEPPSEPLSVSAEAIATLPRELHKALRIAALSLSVEDFDIALDSVREQDPALAEGLTTLAREFRFDQILELLDKAENNDTEQEGLAEPRNLS
jgi:hypothetical protein